MESKQDSELSLALSLTEEEREATEDLDIGYDKATNSWNLIIRYAGDIKPAIKRLNGTIKELLGGFGLVNILQENINELQKDSKVLFIEKPKLLQEESNGNLSLEISGAIRNELSGKGVILGVIDSGIDYLHGDFQDANGKTRILAIYDQRNQKVYSREEIDNAINMGDGNLIGNFDNHGTGVAGIAAGNNGVAYDSELLFVKLSKDVFFNTAALMDAVDFCIRYAISLTKPIVINISLGNNYGAHDGYSLLESYLNYVALIWKNVIVTGTGNEGDKRIHTEIMYSDENLSRELIVGDYETEISFELWKYVFDEIMISLITPGGEIIDLIDGKIKYSTMKEKIYAYYGTGTPFSMKNGIIVSILSKEYISSGIWTIIIKIKSVKGNKADIWLTGSKKTVSNTGFTEAITDTTLTIPSTAKNVISVGSYNDKTITISEFSGRGYTETPVNIKPEIVAPGENILTTGIGNTYIRQTGTSFAAPFVSGMAALLMEWGIVKGNDPFMYGERVKTELISKAKKIKKNDGLPNNRYGWGYIP